MLGKQKSIRWRIFNEHSIKNTNSKNTKKLILSFKWHILEMSFSMAGSFSHNFSNTTDSLSMFSENYPYHVYVTGTTVFNWLPSDKTWYHFQRFERDFYQRTREQNYPLHDMRPSGYERIRPFGVANSSAKG